VPRYHQAITLLAIVLAGVMLGQIVRRARRLLLEFDQDTKRIEAVP